MRTPGFGDRRLSSTSGVLPIACDDVAVAPAAGPVLQRGTEDIASRSVVAGHLLAAPCRGGGPAGRTGASSPARRARGDEHGRMLSLLVLILLMSAFAVAAVRFGADSRPFWDERRPRR